METTTPRGLAPNEYNGLLHAIWLMQKILPEATDQREVEAMNRYIDGLQSLFRRL